MLCWHFDASGVWVRVFGYGLNVRRDMPRLFTERYGFRRVWRLGRWSVELLRPNQ